MVTFFRAGAVMAAALLVLLAAAYGAKADAKENALIARGRYLVTIGGCNDCHTEGWPQSGGTLPVKDWLEGSAVGWHGSWGTSYAVNLRRLLSRLSEKKWLRLIVTEHPKPPMPAWALRAMTVKDREAVYAFIRHLGAKGRKTPKDLPPGVTPPPPAILFPLPPVKTGR